MFTGRVSASFTVPASVTISATTNGGGPTSVTITAETYDSIDSFLTELVTTLNSTRPVTSGTWSASISETTGKVTLAVSASTFSITWTDTNTRDLLGFTGSITSQASATGDNCAAGVWIPDCPISTARRHESAPAVTDRRSTRGPTGVVYTNIGNTRYEHTDLRWSLVPTNRVWRADEVVVGESLEQWLDDTQLGRGHAWFDVGSKCRILAHDSVQVGSADSVVNWWLTGFAGIGDIVTRHDGNGWDGLWSVAIPLASSDGT